MQGKKDLTFPGGILNPWILNKTCLAPQNDRLNLSFMKDMYVDGENLARNGHKTAIYESQI